MSTPLDQLRDHLRQHGFSLTKPRQVIFEALSATESQTMRELVARCADIDRASVYRTIALFERLGIVQRLQIGWKYKLELTGDFVEHHHHMSCLGCGRQIALPEDSIIENQLLKLAAQHNFQTQDHQLEIRGLCRNCQANRTAQLPTHT